MINWGLLVIVLIGIPAASSVEFGSVRLTSMSAAQMLTLWGLGLTAGLNGAASLWLAKRAKTRRTLLVWMAIHIALFTFCWLLIQGHIHFEWLQDFLLWLRDRFSRSE